MARAFTGSDSNYLKAASDVAALDITGSALTIHLWINPTAIAGGAIVSKWDSTNSSAKQYMMQLNGDGTVLVTLQGGGQDLVSSITALTTGSWFPVGMRKNGTGAATLQVFVNGASDNSATSNNTIHDTSTVFHVGRRANTGLPLNAKLAEIGVWNVALTDAELAALGKGVPPLLVRPKNLAGYFPLWGSGSPEADLSGNVNNLSVNGTVAKADHAPAASPFFTTHTGFLTAPVSFTKTGYGVAGLTGAGQRARELLETGAGVVGTVGAGVEESTGAAVYIKQNFATVGADGYGVKSFTSTGGTTTKAGHGVVGTVGGCSSAGVAVQPEGVSIAFADTLLEPFPTWTRIA